MNQLLVIPTLAEASPLIQMAGFEVTQIPGLYHTQDGEFDLLLSGVGIVPTIFSLTRHLAHHSYCRVIHAGIAGSYALSLQPVEIVQVTRDTFADVGIDHGGVFRWVFHENLWNPDEKPFNNGWIEVAEDPSLHLDAVSGITVDWVTGSPDRKARLVDKFNPQTESMEGAAVFYVCKMEGIPVIQLRAISNFVGNRDRFSWKKEEAIEVLTNEIRKILCR